MDAKNVCLHCGAKVGVRAKFCAKCGNEIAVSQKSVLKKSKSSTSAIKNKKSPVTTLVLCLILGVFGAHRFYVGKKGTGLLMLITIGGFGIWALVDLITIVNNKFDDKQGNLLQLTNHPQTSKKKLAMNLGVVSAWFIIFVITISILAMYFTSGPLGVISRQLDAFKDGKLEKAYSYTSKGFQSATGVDEFKKFLERYPSLKNNDRSFFNERQFSGNNMIIKGTLISKEGVKTSIQYQLIKEDGTWKILGLIITPMQK